MEPRIIVLDEPTAGLDPYGRRRVIDLLGSLTETKLIITHDLELVLELCGRACLISAGKTAACGAVREILSSEELLLRHHLEVPYSLRLR